MTSWLQFLVAFIPLMTAGITAYLQMRKRPRATATAVSPSGNRPVLNGFTEVLRETLDKVDGLRRENEQLRIRVAELETALAAKVRKSRSSRPTTTTMTGDMSHAQIRSTP